MMHFLNDEINFSVKCTQTTSSNWIWS